MVPRRAPLGAVSMVPHGPELGRIVSRARHRLGADPAVAGAIGRIRARVSAARATRAVGRYPSMAEFGAVGRARPTAPRRRAALERAASGERGGPARRRSPRVPFESRTTAVPFESRTGTRLEAYGLRPGTGTVVTDATTTLKSYNSKLICLSAQRPGTGHRRSPPKDGAFAPLVPVLLGPVLLTTRRRRLPATRRPLRG